MRLMGPMPERVGVTAAGVAEVAVAGLALVGVALVGVALVEVGLVGVGLVGVGDAEVEPVGVGDAEATVAGAGVMDVAETGLADVDAVPEELAAAGLGVPTLAAGLTDGLLPAGDEEVPDETGLADTGAADDGVVDAGLADADPVSRPLASPAALVVPDAAARSGPFAAPVPVGSPTPLTGMIGSPVDPASLRVGSFCWSKVKTETSSLSATLSAGFTGAGPALFFAHCSRSARSRRWSYVVAFSKPCALA
jgi:hypothetical protein